MAIETKSPLGEFGRIKVFFAPLAAGAPGSLGLMDDAAVIQTDGEDDLIVTVDAMVEGVHFLPSDLPEMVARKLLRTNLSDLAAKSATPEGYFLTMALPSKCDDRWVEKFAAGLAEDQAVFGITLLGGDSVSTPGPITLSITAIGKGQKNAMPRRSGACPGDLVFVSGTIGDGAIGLLVATGQLSVFGIDESNFLRGRYQLPQPRLGLGRALRGTVSAMMDISDGLVADLEHLCIASNVAGVVDAATVPVSDATAATLAADPDLFDLVLGGGDDYELLFTAPAAAEPQIRELSLSTKTSVSLIGRIEAGCGVRVLDREGIDIHLRHRGFRHS